MLRRALPLLALLVAVGTAGCTQYIRVRHRLPAEIDTSGREIVISDLGSQNGTRVNGHAVKQSPLQPGDRIDIADVELVFER